MGLRLLTNVPPAAYRGDISWQAPGLQSNEPPADGRFRGTPSILKSALQKNVRLCRPGSAVRCAPGRLLERNSAVAAVQCAEAAECAG